MSVDARDDMVVVTGANGGIGLAVCTALKARGTRLIAVTRSEPSEALRSVSDHIVRLDLMDLHAIEEAAKEIRELAGGRLGGLVNNAGIATLMPFENLGSDGRDRQLQVNIIGPLELTRLLLPLLRAARGRLVNITSLAGRLPMPFNAVHCGTKHFLEGWSDALRIELAPLGVSVSLVEPGVINTPMLEAAIGSTDQAVAEIGEDRVTVYDGRFHGLLKSMDKGINDGSPPSVVAYDVVHALYSDRPKTRYPSGKAARPAMLMARFLPDRLQDAVVSRMFGLEGDR